MRKAVYQLLTSNAALIADIPANRWYERGSVVDSPALPFATIVWGGAAYRGVGRTVKRLEIWVYDKPGDTVLMNRVIENAANLLLNTFDYVFAGERFSSATFVGTSPDLPDDVYRATTRNLALDCAGSGL